VWGFPSFDEAELMDHPGLQGLPVRVRIYYRWAPLDPLLQAILPNGILISGEAVMINEGVQTSVGAVAPPTFAPPATLDAPTGVPTMVGGTPTFTPTPTWTPTPTVAPPTPTPTGAYIVLLNDADEEISPWPWTALPDARAQLRQHNPGDYTLYWTDNCGVRTSLGLPAVNVPALGATPVVELPDGFSYLSDGCGGIREDETYACEISSCPPSGTCASSNVDVYVPITRPDLVVRRFLHEGVPITEASNVPSGQPIIIEVEIRNDGDRVVTGTFDVDIYVDPPDPSQVLKQLPGMGTSDGSSPKQWHAGPLAPGDTARLSYVITFYTGDEHILMAQVDTSDMIEEGDEENNISAPVSVIAECSDRCDDFNNEARSPAEWQLSLIEGSGAGTTTMLDASLQIEGTAMYLYHQGWWDGGFRMTVKVNDYPRLVDDSRAGLMAIESLDPAARYVAVAVVSVGGSPHLGVYARETTGAVPTTLCGGPSAIPSFGEGIWVRLVRDGDLFTVHVSTDGDSFSSVDCAETTLPGFADPAVPGILMAPGG
jgi:hypothetical protein